MIIIKTANGDRFINESEAQSVTHNKEYGFVVITFKDGHSENAFQVESMYYTNKQDAKRGVDTEKDGLSSLLTQARDTMNEIPEMD